MQKYMFSFFLGSYGNYNLVMYHFIQIFKLKRKWKIIQSVSCDIIFKNVDSSKLK